MTEVEIFKQSLDVSRIMMVITIIVSITTVIFSALSMAFQRSHNKRSVKPFCTIIRVVESSEIVIRIKNAGLGPLILGNIKILIDKDEVVEIEEYLKEYLHQKSIQISKVKSNNHVVISTNADEKVIVIKNLKAKIGIFEEVSNKIASCIFIVEYCDIYEKQYQTID